MSANTPVAIVTGAGSGIGRCVAFELARLNYRLSLVGRTETKLRDTRAHIEREVSRDVQTFIHAADLSDEQAPQRIITDTLERFGRIDALVNNAGKASVLPISHSDVHAIRETFEVNTFAPAQLIAHVWPVFEHQTPLSDHPSPCVINVSTLGTADPFPGFFLYAASKCAIESFVRSIVREESGQNVRAFVVAPGAVETPLLRSLFDEHLIPRDQTLDPAEVASVIVACIRGERDEMNGQTIYLTSQTDDS